jgi:hypothetical protein
MAPENVTEAPVTSDVPVTLNVPVKLPFANAGAPEVWLSVKVREALVARSASPLKAKKGIAVKALEYKVLKVNVLFWLEAVPFMKKGTPSSAAV